MIYTEVEKKELDEVQRVFAEHLRQCPDYELLWSDMEATACTQSGLGFAGNAWSSTRWASAILTADTSSLSLLSA